MPDPTSERVLACDCDLHCLHAWDSARGKVCTAAPDIDAVALHIRGEPVDTVLFEIASPVSGSRSSVSGNAVNYQLMRWVIWNSSQAERLTWLLPNQKILVAPSNKWTKGHPAEARHKLCQAKGSNHDLRECEAMIWYYRHEPETWVPLRQYLKEI